MKNTRFLGKFIFVLLIGISLFSFQTAFIFGNSWRNTLGHVSENMYFSVYLQDKVSEVNLSEILSKLEEIPGIQKVDYVDRNAFLGMLKSKHPEIYSDVKSLKNARVIPRYFRLALDGSGAEFDKIISTASSIEGVDFVDSNRKKQFTIFSALRKTEWLLLLLAGGFFMLLTFCFFLAGIIRFHSESEKIRVLHDLGASLWKLKLPFVIEGGILGLIGGLVAVSIYHFTGNFIGSSISSVLSSQIGKTMIENPQAWSFQWILIWALPPVLGLLSGFSGSYLGFSAKRSIS